MNSRVLSGLLILQVITPFIVGAIIAKDEFIIGLLLAFYCIVAVITVWAWQDEPKEINQAICSRKDRHFGPCNGYPRPDCQERFSG